MLRKIQGVCVAVLVVFNMAMAQGGDTPPASKKDMTGDISFNNDVFPIIGKHCLPCHAEENFNPSELSMDTYDMLVAGGENGTPLVAGKSSESLIIRKLGKNPPKGERMPLNPKKKIKAGKAVWLTDEEVKVIAEWIDQGAKDN